MHRHVHELQLNLFSATYLKQRWMFPNIVQKYIALSMRLLTLPRDDDGIAVFQDDDGYELTNVTAQCKWHRINAKSFMVRSKLLKNNVKLLAHAVQLSLYTDVPLQRLCTECVIKIFQFSALPTKNTCLRYFSKLYSLVGGVKSAATAHTLLHIFVGISNICSKEMFVWQRDRLVVESDVQSFYKSASTLIRLAATSKYVFDDDNCILLIETCWPLLQKSLAASNEETTFTTNVCRFLKAMLNNSPYGQNVSVALFQKLQPEMIANNLTPAIANLFEFVFVREMKQNDTTCMELMPTCIAEICQRCLKSSENDVGRKYFW